MILMSELGVCYLVMSRLDWPFDGRLAWLALREQGHNMLLSYRLVRASIAFVHSVTRPGPRYINPL